VQRIAFTVLNHVFSALTLYLTAIAVRFGAQLLSVRVLLSMVHGLVQLMWCTEDVDFRHFAIWSLKLGVTWALLLFAGVYRKVMLPRLPMLTVRLHKDCIRRGLVHEGDWRNVWDVLEECD